MHFGMRECRLPLASDLVSGIIALEHISYIICSRNSKVGMWMPLQMVECHIPFGITVILTSDLVSRLNTSRT